MPVWGTINAFNAGELSPKMLSRADVSQYGKGCQELTNFLVTPYGAVERRPGTQFISETKDSSPNIRLIRFAFSSTISYICEFGEKYIRFYRNGKIVRNDAGILELATEYLAEHLAALQFVQSADVMIICHPLYEVRELRRVAADDFQFAAKSYSYPPMLDPNLDNSLKLSVEGDLAVNSEVTLSATGNVFNSDNVGGYYQLIHTRNEGEISFDFKADGSTDHLEVKGFWSFTSHGTWTGNLSLERSFDNGSTWTKFRTYGSAKDNNVSDSGTEEADDVLYRVTMEDYEQSSSGTLKLCRVLFINPDFVTAGVVKVTGYTDPTKVTGFVLKKIGSAEPTAEWNEGAWSIRRGFPCSVAFFEERIVFAGTAYQPQTIWASKTNDWDDFLIGDQDDAGISVTLASDTVNTICWMCQHDALIIGTLDSEWTLSASSREDALTPTSLRIKRQSVYGSSPISATMAGEVVLFLQRGSRKIREFVYSWEKDGYSAADLTILADHITSSGVCQIALQQLPDTILWCLLNDGTVACLTYERSQEVIGWQKFTTSGRVVSISVVPAGAEDDVYFAVERSNGTYIEKLAPRQYDQIAQAFYVDSGVTVKGENITEVGGLFHLENETVAILADGAAVKAKQVRYGSVLLDKPASTVTVGLPYVSTLRTMPLEADTQNGSSVCRRKSVGELRIRYYDSVGGEAKAGDDSYQLVRSRDILTDPMDKAIEPKTDVAILGCTSGMIQAMRVEIIQDQPLPLNVNSITYNMEINE